VPPQGDGSVQGALTSPRLPGHIGSGRGSQPLEIVQDQAGKPLQIRNRTGSEIQLENGAILGPFAVLGPSGVEAGYIVRDCVAFWADGKRENRCGRDASFEVGEGTVVLCPHAVIAPDRSVQSGCVVVDGERFEATRAPATTSSLPAYSSPPSYRWTPPSSASPYSYTAPFAPRRGASRSHTRKAAAAILALGLTGGAIYALVKYLPDFRRRFVQFPVWTPTIAPGLPALYL